MSSHKDEGDGLPFKKTTHKSPDSKVNYTGTPGSKGWTEDNLPCQLTSSNNRNVSISETPVPKATILQDSTREAAPITEETTLQQDRYKCLICPPVKRKVYTGRRSFKQHLSHHLPPWAFRCPEGCSWHGLREDKLRKHLQTAHQIGKISNVQVAAARVEVRAPRTCPLCNRPTSWVEIYQCLCNHSRIIATPSTGNARIGYMPKTSKPEVDGGSDSAVFEPRARASREIGERDYMTQSSGLKMFETRAAEPQAAQGLLGRDTEWSSENGPTGYHQYIDSEVSPVHDLDVILRPIEYYKELYQLENETVDFCGQYWRDVSAQLNASGTVTSQDSIATLCGCRDALHNLRSKGFCGSILTIFVESAQSFGVANAIHLSLEEIETLTDLLLVTQPPQLEEVTGGLIQYLVCKIQGQDVEIGDPYDFPSYLCFLCASLSLGIELFSGSHVCSVELKNRADSEGPISVGLGYSFYRRKLACMDGFIGGPLWVLGKDDTWRAPADLKLALTVQDLQQLWGPIWMVGGNEYECSFLRTERGFIFPLPVGEQDDINHKTACHWAGELPNSFGQEYRSEERIRIKKLSVLLIGANEFLIGAGLAVNTLCTADMSLVQQQFASKLQLPGTHKAYYLGDGFEVSLGGGYGNATAGFTKKWKRMPSRTHKSALIEICTKPGINLIPILNLQVGLEVSVCTGNSRRVSLWDAIRLCQVTQKSLDPDYLPGLCQHAAGSIECVSYCWNRGLSHNLDYNVDTPDQSGLLGKVDARQTIINAILGLEHTGIDKKGHLRALWPFYDCVYLGDIGPSTYGQENHWLPIAKDTQTSSTFAILSKRCLVFHDASQLIQIKGCFQPQVTQPKPTVLSTKIFATEPTDRKDGIGIEPHSNLSVGETNLSVLSADPTRVVARVMKFGMQSWLSKRTRFQEQIDPMISPSESLWMIAC